ncbi:nicotinate-nucleotide--dimethylbenzimidazole phosphoribosyltransferase [Thermosulfuriphilus sp.]
MRLLDKTVKSIQPIDEILGRRAQEHLDNLTKPRGSLGRLEEFARRYCAIVGDLNPRYPRKVVCVFAGDHGVAEEGVSAFPKEVTYQMVRNFLLGGAGINVLARHVGAEVKVIDMGVDHDLADIPGLLVRKVGWGTANFTKGPAMTREQAITAIETGIKVAQEMVASGFRLLGTGEMGIANTTPASAITAVICSEAPETVTGRGTGIDQPAWRKKVEVIRAGIALNRPDPTDPIDVLAKVGGFEIGGICGFVLGAAALGCPVVIDGFISSAGALLAYEMAPTVAQYLYAGHCSVEQGHRIQLTRMGLTPILDLNLRLGEGTGAALAMGLIEAGVKIYREMATFSGAGVSPGSEAEDMGP